ncbi:MAG: RDD family protein [Pseudohongiellaceae bacterium]|jgi:uncharacterized RDD family membrane protein YckC
MTDFTATPSTTPAPFWRRLAAIAYDSVLIIAIWMVVAFVVLSLFGVDNARTVDGEVVTLDPVYKNVLLVAMILSAWSFFAWFWTHSGQTLGMQAWRVRIQNSGNNRITLIQTVIRFAGALASMLPVGIGYWLILFSQDRKSLHDRLSGSEVVLVPLMEKDGNKKTG